MPISLRDLRRWFVISGCIGIVVALVLAAVTYKRPLSPMLLLALRPPSIVGIADPTTLSDQIVIGVYEFGGNFLLYGIVGTALGCVFRLVSWR